MLTLLNLAQLILYIALLALLGQAALHVLAGQGRDGNLFYRLLKLLASPFTRLVRQLTPRQLADAHVPWLTFIVLFLLYVMVTLKRADLCFTGHLMGQAGCR